MTSYYRKKDGSIIIINFLFSRKFPIFIQSIATTTVTHVALPVVAARIAQHFVSVCSIVIIPTTIIIIIGRWVGRCSSTNNTMRLTLYTTLRTRVRTRKSVQQRNTRTHTQKSRCKAPAGSGGRRARACVCACPRKKCPKCKKKSARIFIINRLVCIILHVCVLTPMVVVSTDQILFAHIQRRFLRRRFRRVFALLVLRRTVRSFRVVRATRVPRRVHLHGDGRRAVLHYHNIRAGTVVRPTTLAFVDTTFTYVILYFNAGRGRTRRTKISAKCTWTSEYNIMYWIGLVLIFSKSYGRAAKPRGPRTTSELRRRH